MLLQVIHTNHAKIPGKLQRFSRFPGPLKATGNKPEFYQFWRGLGSSTRVNLSDYKVFCGKELRGEILGWDEAREKGDKEAQNRCESHPRLASAPKVRAARRMTLPSQIVASITRE